MPITISDGTNRSITSVTVGDGGTNRVIREIWVGDAGTNRLVFAAVNLQGLDPFASAPVPGPATAAYDLTSGGLEQATGSASGTWLVAGVGADYDCMMTVNSGSLTSGTVGSWLNLGTTRSWTLTRNGAIGTTTCNCTIQIRSASSLAVLASANVMFTAETA